MVRQIAAMPVDLLGVAEEPPTLEEAYLRLVREEQGLARGGCPMKGDVIWAIAAKDLRESAATSQVLAPVVIVPFVFVVLYPVGLLLALRYMSAADAKELIAKIPTSAFPGAGELSVQGQAAYIATVYLFAGFFLIIPTMVAVVLAANSFAGEKERHTLEGVLYTPVSDTELVVGKILGAVLPAVVVSWVCFGVYAVLVNVLGNPLVGHLYFPTPNWWVLMLLVVPAVSVFVTACVVWVSARVGLLPVGQLDRRLRGAAADPARGRPGHRRDAARAHASSRCSASSWSSSTCCMMRWIISTFDREKVVASFL